MCDCDEPVVVTTEHDPHGRWLFRHGAALLLVTAARAREANCPNLEAIGDRLVVPWLRGLGAGHGYEPLPPE
jgi:hypothetical protein